MNVAGVATSRMYFWATQDKQACRAISWAAGRGRPPQAAARRAGLEVVEKLLTSSIYAEDKTGSARSSRRGIVAP
jgi:ribosomal protein S12 methylthiotransferase accessory factor YcaO